MARTLRLGTRRSTLAWAQSLWVAERVRELAPDIVIELVPIETQGDRINNVPLREIEGKDFFTAELDAALLDKRVDLTVHSLKDLSLERPQGIHLAAIPARENPRDVVIFRSDTPERLSAGRPLRIGTSAPRRLENVPKFLQWALPQGAQPPQLNFVEIRGNVDTRLGRLHEPDDSERQLDGVVLAFAGLIRLWRDNRPSGQDRGKNDSGHERLTALLRDTRWMILPLAECPAAPGQGALAVECRSDDTQLRTVLAKLNDAQTTRQVDAERAVLARFGGGCHQAFGATCVTHPACGDVLYVRGKAEHGATLDSATWLSLPPLSIGPAGKIVAWNGLQVRESAEHQDIMHEVIEMALSASRAPLFIAHSRALPNGVETKLQGRRVWTSGTASWKRLAKRGVWVEGCADALGFDWIASTLDEPVLQLPALDDWQILTHAAAIETWPAGEVLATYALPEKEAQTIANAAAITHAYWASGSQFRDHYSQLPTTVHHACGPGKTADLIRAAGIDNLTVFPSADEWQRWLNPPNN